MHLVIEGSEEDKILHRKAKKVNKIDDSIRTICMEMEKLMLKNNGIGISGNQVGILKRIIVIMNESTIIHMINPEIVNVLDEWENGEEGCLSIPNTFIYKKRLKQITVKYRNLKGTPVLETYTGLTSRVIQHEIDHLNGVLMV
jgi:peptide deformylase